MQNKLLFITFDNIRDEDDPEISLGIASIFAYLKNDAQINNRWNIEHKSVNIFNVFKSKHYLDYLDNEIRELNLSAYKIIAVSAYIWHEYLTNDFLTLLRKKGFRGKIILGGYQIAESSLSDYKKRYPNADIFVEGYAEQAIKEILLGKTSEKLLNIPVNFAEIPPIYSNETVEVRQNIPMIRLETKRGCPFRCSFCRFMGNVEKGFKNLNCENIFREIDFLTAKNVQKINVVDPIFNVGDKYLSVMEHIYSAISKNRADTIFDFQCRLEFLLNSDGERFLELCADRHKLEFGIQTINSTVAENIGRKNDIDKIKKAFEMLTKYNVKYEVSIMYGLPGQTLDIFRETITFLKDFGCSTIKAFPLNLYCGTKLFTEKDKWDMTEELNEYGISEVRSSSSFSVEEWLEMDNIAKSINLPYYYLNSA